MNESRSLMVGYDFSNDYTQISCYSTKYYEPESIGVTDQEQYLIPTVLCVKNDSKEWLFGEDALDCVSDEKGILVDQLVSLAKSEDTITVFDTNFVASNLLEKFFRKTLSILKRKYPGNSISQLVVTVEELDECLEKCIYTAFLALGIDNDRLVIKSHANSAMYYALNQPKELWMNDIAVFHYDRSGLYYYHIAINRRTKPCAVTVEKENLTSSFGTYDFTKEDKSDLAYLFLKLAKTILSKQIISTVYITGKGFEGNWIDASLQELCMGRRVFKGQNLYTKGACYMAREIKGEKKLEDYIILSEEMLHTRVWMSAYVDAATKDITLVQIGTPAKDAKQEFEVIFDGKSEVVIYTRNLFERETKKHVLSLPEYKERQNRMTRANIQMTCKDTDYMEVILTDLGFGEFYPATNETAEYLIKL